MSQQKKFFEGTSILNDQKLCKAFMGQYPVISITLKDVFGRDFDGAYKNFAALSPAVYEYLGYLCELDNQHLQDLADGKNIRMIINNDMNYDCVDKHNPVDFWSLLLHTGYLTITEGQQAEPRL